MFKIKNIVDFHTHIYWGVTPLGIFHKELIEQTGPVLYVDAGSSGLHTFPGFRKYVVDSSEIPVFAFIHLCVNGLTSTSGYVNEIGELQDKKLIAIEETAKIIIKNSDVIIGIKLRLDKWTVGDNGEELLEKAIELSDMTGKPLMIHIAGSGLKIEKIFPKLRKGDVVSHIFRPEPNSILNENFKIKKCVIEAREKGVIFDLAHGGGAFSFEIAEKAILQKFYPDIISSDIHNFCRDTPTILDKYADIYLINPKNLKSPFMTLAFETKEQARKDIPAALHPADFTARPQILEKEANPSYYDLISEFEKITGVGALLNTSFNLHGDPIVRGPEQAIYTFENSELDMLLMNDILISRVNG